MKKDEPYKGFETWWHGVLMHLKMHAYIVAGLAALQLLGALLLSLLFYPGTWSLVTEHFISAVWTMDAWYAASVLTGAWKLLSWPLLLAAPVYLLYPRIFSYMRQRARAQAEDRFERGTLEIPPDTVRALMAAAGEAVDLPLGEIRMPRSAEVKHVLAIGRPGVGKTVLLSGVLEQLLTRGERGIVYDFKGDYLSKFYRPGRDILFNPLDRRCQGWSVFNEVRTFMDVDAISHSLIPPGTAEERFWLDGARDVFAGILHYLYGERQTRNRDIWNAVSAPAKNIVGWLSRTSGGERGLRYVEDASSKQALGILATMMQFTKSFEYMAESDGPFCLSDWLERGEGWIYVTSYSDVQDTLRPVLSLFIDLLGRKLLSMPDDHERRIFFLLDELGTLQRLSTIVRLLTLSRSKGGSVWVGVQDVGQVDKIYTPATRQSLFNATGTSMMFAVADPDTADYLSRRIGEAEWEEVEQSFSMGVEDHRDGVSLARRNRVKRVLLPSELMGLPDLEALVKLPNYPLTRAQLTFVPRLARAERFFMRPELALAAGRAAGEERTTPAPFE